MPKGKGKRTVEDVMHKFKAGTLRSGSGQKVTNRKQAIAIGISEGYPKRRKKKRRRTGY
jgi:hypothetical protein